MERGNLALKIDGNGNIFNNEKNNTSSKIKKILSIKKLNHNSTNSSQIDLTSNVGLDLIEIMQENENKIKPVKNIKQPRKILNINENRTDGQNPKATPQMRKKELLSMIKQSNTPNCYHLNYSKINQKSNYKANNYYDINFFLPIHKMDNNGKIFVDENNQTRLIGNYMLDLTGNNPKIVALSTLQDYINNIINNNNSGINGEQLESYNKFYNHELNPLGIIKEKKGKILGLYKFILTHLFIIISKMGYSKLEISGNEQILLFNNEEIIGYYKQIGRIKSFTKGNTNNYTLELNKEKILKDQKNRKNPGNHKQFI